MTINVKRKYIQTENFDANKIILDNLDPDEKILYKLESFEFVRFDKFYPILGWLVLDLFLIPLFIFTICHLFLNLFLGTIIFIILYCLIFIFTSFYFYQKSIYIFENQLYITSNKICIIHDVNQSHERIYYINFNELQCISFRKRRFISKKKDSGKIEFISKAI